MRVISQPLSSLPVAREDDIRQELSSWAAALPKEPLAQKTFDDDFVDLDVQHNGHT